MLYNRGWARDFHYLIISAGVPSDMSRALLDEQQVIWKPSLSNEPSGTLVSASYTPGNQHIYFSCKTSDCQAVFAQSPNNYPITVFVVQGIERGLPAVDWVKFLWLASHPSEKIHNDEGIPGQFDFTISDPGHHSACHVF